MRLLQHRYQLHPASGKVVRYHARLTHACKLKVKLAEIAPATCLATLVYVARFGCCTLYHTTPQFRQY